MKHRCKNCNKQLAQGIFSGTIAIKCPRCKMINQLNAHEHLLATGDAYAQNSKPTTRLAGR